MKRAALLFSLLFPLICLRAGTLDDSAKELARRLSRFRPATVTLLNPAGVPAGDLVSLRRVLLAEVGGTPNPGQAPAEIRVTVSTNLTETVLVAQAQHGEERQVEIVSQPRRPASGQDLAMPVTIDKQLVYSQPAFLLDVLAPASGHKVILEPGRVVILDGTTQREMRIPMAYTPVRDLTGRLSQEDGRLTATLDGVSCSADLSSEVRVMDCQPVDTPPGPPESVANFRRLMAGAEGWDVVSLEGTPACGRYLLAAPPAGDQVRAYLPGRRTAQPASDPLELGGTLTALSPAPGGAMAIVYEEKTDRYAAYLLAPTCSR